MKRYRIIKSMDCVIEADNKQEAFNKFKEGKLANPQFEIQEETREGYK